MMPARLMKPVTLSAITRAMVGGFAIVILLLLAAGLLGVRNIGAIRATASRLALEQKRTTDLLDAVLRQQRALSGIYANFMKSPEELDQNQLLEQLESSRSEIEAIVRGASGEPEQPLWADLESAVHLFVADAGEQLKKKGTGPAQARELLGSRQQVDRLVVRLVERQTSRSLQLKQELEALSTKLLQESAVLLGGGLLLAILIAFATFRYAGRLIREMEWQTGELSRVSWQMLEKQESTARRFSHELHDELGQSLTAVKANLVAMDGASNGTRERVDDCLHLVDEAIVNVREMSQLLRPTILDDFGLDASLRWLCERFHQRTGLDVKFEGGMEARLSDELETHLFRIAQEALTNIARHAQAKHVAVSLRHQDSAVTLSVKDDGLGIGQGKSPVEVRGLGMVGMRARARSAGGELKVDSSAGKGTLIEASFPFRLREA